MPLFSTSIRLPSKYLDLTKQNNGAEVFPSIIQATDGSTSSTTRTLPATPTQQALDAGCQHFKIGLMTERTKVCRSGFTLGGKTFEPYDPTRCLAFVQDAMQQTIDRATVYWKQSFRDFIGGTGKHRLFSDDELHKIFDDYPNAVGKDWSMFNPQNK